MVKRGLRRGEVFLKDKEFSKDLVADYSKQISATEALSDNPFAEFTSIHIHTANICSAKCVFCSYSQHVDKKSVMDLDVFKKIIDEYVQLGGNRIYFSPNAGDPLVDVTLVEKAEYARSIGIKYIGMITNGILFNRKDVYKELMPLVDNIGVSLPGLDRDAYKRLFGVDKASTVENNLLLMANEKKVRGLNTEILLLFRIDRPFQDVMQDAGMQNIKPFIDDGTIRVDLDDILIEVDDWCGQIKESDLPGLMTIEKRKFKEKIEPCSRLYTDLAILPDGTAKICACRYLKTHYDGLVIGDLKHSTIDKTFFGAQHKKILDNVREGKWPEVCKACNFYTPIKS